MRSTTSPDPTVTLSLLPLFPLPLVLFPGQVRQLRVFEPRYRALLQDCLSYQTPFGLVLAKPPLPDGDEVLPHIIGAAAHITEVDRLEDGAYGITVQGGDRFRLTDFRHEKAYLQGIAEPMPMLQTETDQAYELHKRVLDLLPKYLDALTQASGLRLNVHAFPPEPEYLAYLTGIVLQVGNNEKQDLLATRHLPVLLAKEIRLLHNELDLMSWISSTVEATNTQGFGTAGWMNLN